MKTKVLKKFGFILVIISALAIISSSIYAQIDPIGEYYYPVWSLTGIGAPWWAIAGREPIILPHDSQWPWTRVFPFTTGLGGYGTTGFAGIGLCDYQFTELQYPQGFAAMPYLPPCFGLSIGLGMGAFGGLGVTRFGSPEATTTMGVPWNWQPFFGVTSISPGYFYLGMSSPWWATMGPVMSY